MKTDRDWRKYLGDAVYADFDGYHIILTTPTHNGCEMPPPESTIALEPDVFMALVKYKDEIMKEMAKVVANTDTNAG